LRIAQITDLHLRQHLPGTAQIAKRRSREAPALFEQALRDAADRGADVLAITGDLVDVPSYLLEPDDVSDLDRTRGLRAAEADYRLVKAMLDASGLPYLVLPGNHDSYRLMANVFSDGPHVRDVGGLRFVTFWDREHRHNVPRRFGVERKRFDDCLLDPDPRPQVHLQHFVITPELNRGYPHTYLEGAELTRRIAGSDRVRLALSGHYHRGTALIQDGSAAFATGPALCEPPHPYRIYDVPTKLEAPVALEEFPLRENPPKRKAVFLDRDGSISARPVDRSGPRLMELLPGAAPGLRALRNAGYALVVITNQSCVASGYTSPDIVQSAHDQMAELLAAEGAGVDAVYASYGEQAGAVHPSLAPADDTSPLPAMILRAADELSLDLGASYMIGSNPADIEAARGAGIGLILVRTAPGVETTCGLKGLIDVPAADNVAAAAGHILRS
jgi:histidinol-phosphate phosphatase family protein